MKNSRRAIFLDRDGVINENLTDNVRTWEQFRFEHGALEALSRPELASYVLVVVTNQSGIARGHMTEETVCEIHRNMIAEIERGGGHIDRVMYCPHLTDAGCSCRKPSPEMLFRSRDEFDLDLTNSFFVGDWVDDVLAARAAGVTPVLVRTGRGRKALTEMQSRGIPPPETYENLAAALTAILDKQHSTLPI